MKRFVVLALIAVTSASFVAGSANAANTPIANTWMLADLKSGKTSEKDINALFNAVGLTATSVSVGAALGSFSIVTSHKPVVKQVEYSVLGGSHVLGLSLGKKNEILGIKWTPNGPPSSRPIPEARTMLLYPLGLLAIGWVIMRSRRAAATTQSR